MLISSFVSKEKLRICRVGMGLLFCFLPFVINAQNFGEKKFYLIDNLDLGKVSDEDRKLIDSALGVYHSSKNDTARIHAVNKIIDKSWDDRVWPRYNQWMYSKVKSLLKKKSDHKTTVRLKKFLSGNLNNFGVIAINKGEIDTALRYFHQSLEIEREVSGPLSTATSLSNIGYIYSNQGDIPKALEYYHQALDIQEKIKDSVGISRSLNNIGFIYQNLGDGKKALEYYTESLKIREAIGDDMGIAVSYTNMAEVYAEMGEIQKVISYYRQSLIIYDQINNRQGVASTLNNIGFAFITYGVPDCKESKAACKTAALDSALFYCQKSWTIQVEVEDKYGGSSSLNNLGRIFLSKGDRVKAKQFAMEAYQSSKELGYPENIKKAASLLKEISFLEGNFKLAYEYFQEEIKMRDSLEDKNNYKEAQQKQAQYFYKKIHQSDSVNFARQKELDQVEIANQRLEIRSRRNQQIILYAGVILLLVVAGFIFNRFKITNKQKKIIEHQKILVEEKNKEVTDSINYAKRIQDAILPSTESLNRTLKNGFVIYQPKDIVAGDFYWMEEVSATATAPAAVFIAVADCTGHGVPGAMVSVICSGALNRAVKEFKMADPGQILDKVRELILATFEKSDTDMKDGMDISLLVIPSDSLHGNLKVHRTIRWAGANNPLWILRKEKIIEIQPDKQPVGKYLEEKPFTTQALEIESGDVIYLFTDGFTDQFGGPKGKKLKYSSLKRMIIETRDLHPHDQKEVMVREFELWKGDLEQVDDVCLVGIKI